MWRINSSPANLRSSMGRGDFWKKTRRWRWDSLLGSRPAVSVAGRDPSARIARHEAAELVQGASALTGVVGAPFLEALLATLDIGCHAVKRAGIAGVRAALDVVREFPQRGARFAGLLVDAPPDP